MFPINFFLSKLVQFCMRLHASKYVFGDNLCCYMARQSWDKCKVLIGSYLVRILPHRPSLHHTENHKTCKFIVNQFSPSDIGALQLPCSLEGYQGILAPCHSYTVTTLGQYTSVKPWQSAGYIEVCSGFCKSDIHLQAILNSSSIDFLFTSHLLNFFVHEDSQQGLFDI